MSNVWRAEGAWSAVEILSRDFDPFDLAIKCGLPVTVFDKSDGDRLVGRLVASNLGPVWEEKQR